MTMIDRLRRTALVLAIIGDIALPMGVVGHEGSTLIVCVNGLRLLGKWY